MNRDGVHDPGNDQHGESCFEEGHLPGCPGAAGGEHELDAEWGVPMRVYIAGPMTGIAEFNFPAFNRAADQWREAGHIAVNPADNANGDTSKPYAYYLRLDIQHLLSAEAIALLPGWEASRGASLELAIARALDYPVFDAETMDRIA